MFLKARKKAKNNPLQLLHYSYINMFVMKTERDKEDAAVARALLAVRGWSHAELAERAGLKVVTVAHVLAGQYPHYPAKAAINAAFGREIFLKPETKQAPTPKDRMVRSGSIITRGTK